MFWEHRWLHIHFNVLYNAETLIYYDTNQYLPTTVAGAHKVDTLKRKGKGPEKENADSRKREKDKKKTIWHSACKKKSASQ